MSGRRSFADAIDLARGILRSCAPPGAGWSVEFHGSPTGDVKVAVRIKLPDDASCSGDPVLESLEAMLRE